MAFTWLDLLKACALGMLDGLTEFVPVSAAGISCWRSASSASRTKASASHLRC
jgi:undecaprenyl pyrophosphate phosphatase UppP